VADFGNFLKVSRHRIFHEIVGRKAASGGQFVQAGLRVGFEVDFHRCEFRDVATLCQKRLPAKKERQEGQPQLSSCHLPLTCHFHCRACTKVVKTAVVALHLVERTLYASTHRYDSVGPRYFETIGTRFLRGRPIDEQDTPNSHHVAAINDVLARKFFPNEDPLGKHLGFNSVRHGGDYEIVGIVENTRYLDPKIPADPMVFLSLLQTVTYEDPTQRRISKPRSARLLRKSIRISLSSK
jgi:hypothetical protein